MTGIFGLGPLAGPRPGGRPAAARGTFSVPAEAEAKAGEAAAAAEVGWAGMLALQEAEADAGQDREARRHGQDMLAELAGLQRDLLGDCVDPARLSRLAELASVIPAASDARLRAALRAVALRARVEMARWATPGR